MSRWDPGDKRQMLQVIADDERRPVNEREAARRELTTAPPVQPHCRVRNAGVEPTQDDQDADIENSFNYDDQLTTQDRIEIERGLDPQTQNILAAFGSPVLWLFGNNAAEIQLLIDLHGRTQSDFHPCKDRQNNPMDRRLLAD